MSAAAPPPPDHAERPTSSAMGDNVGRSTVAAIGEEVRVAGYALAGVEVHAAEDAASALAAWEVLGDEVGCLIVTATAHAALAPRLTERPRLVWAVVAG